MQDACMYGSAKTHPPNVLAYQSFPSKKTDLLTSPESRHRSVNVIDPDSIFYSLRMKLVGTKCEDAHH
jgi:hypothetical protein